MTNKNTRPVYFAGLNGLRTIAALAVVVSHITLNLPQFGLDPHIFGTFPDGKPKGLDLAGHGVSIFFVLSGFLITYLLLAEKQQHPVDIKKFYLRRILRIWPLYYLYLAIAIVVTVILNLKFDGRMLLLYIFYAANIPFILETTIPLIAHYWSLGVEEQFYLFWPWVVKKIDKLVGPIVLFIAVLMGTKLFVHFVTGPNTLPELIIDTTRFHCMMIGALGAILYRRGNHWLIKLADNKLMQAGCWGVLLLVAVNKFHVASVIDTELISVMAMCLIVGQINITNRLINLENNVFDFLGKISYGIYVIHPLLIFLLSKIIPDVPLPSPLNYISVYLLITGATVLLAWLSYSYFEKPFLRLKNRFVVVKSTAATHQ